MAQNSNTPLLRIELRSPKQETSSIGLLQRRGINLPSITTTFHDKMSKQQVTRYKKDLVETHSYLEPCAPEVSKWSSDSSGRCSQAGTSNSTNNTSKEPESPFDHNETAEERLERWQKFYSEKTMESYLDKDDYEGCRDDLLFDTLYKEVQFSLYETGAAEYRGQEHVRFFWDDVRRQLKDDEEQAVEWPPTEKLQHCTASMYDDNPLRHFQPLNPPEHFVAKRRRSRSASSRPKSPMWKKMTTTQDPELMDIREWLMKRMRERKEKE
jgi:hypothetical protein